MKWLWSFEQLAKICRHKKVNLELLKWATSRITALYPEQASEVLIGMLLRDDSLSAREALNYIETSTDQKYLEPLQKAFMKHSGDIAGTIAHILTKFEDAEFLTLFRQKYDNNIKRDLRGYCLSFLSIIKSSPPENKDETSRLLAEFPAKNFGDAGAIFVCYLNSGHSIESLLTWCFQKSQHFQYFPTAFFIIGDYCSVDLDVAKIDLIQRSLNHSNLEEKEETDDWEKWGTAGIYKTPESLRKDFLNSLDTLQKHHLWDANNSVREMFETNQYENIINAIYHQLLRYIEKKKMEVGEESYAQWESNETGAPYANILAIIAFYAQMNEIPEPFKIYAAYGALIFFDGVITLDRTVGRLMAGKPVDEILDCFLEERIDVTQDTAAIEALKLAPQMDSIVTACIQKFENKPDSLATHRIVQFLDSVGTREIAERLLTVDAELRDLAEDSAKMILKLGPTIAMDFAVPIIQNHDSDCNRIFCALQVLAALPTDDVVLLLLEHWNWLWPDNKNNLMDTLVHIGDKRFLEPLKKELNEYFEPPLTTYRTICQINGIQDPRIAKMEKKTKEFQRRKRREVENLEKKDLLDALIAPKEVILECRACGKIESYLVYSIQVALQVREVFIQDPITCTRCGAFNHYRMSPEMQLSIIMMGIVLIKLKKEIVPTEQLVISLTNVSPVDGRLMNVEEMLHHYEEKLAQEPENPLYLLAYANTLRTGKQAETAQSVLEQCIKSDPMAVEGYLSLGEHQEHKGNFAAAYDYYWKAAEIMDTGNYYKLTQDREEMKKEFAIMFDHVAHHVNKSVHPALADHF